MVADKSSRQSLSSEVSILQILVALGNLFVAGNGQFCLTVYITPSELHLFLWNIKVLIKQGDNLHVFT